MTKRDLVKIIIDQEYTKEQQMTKGLVKGRSADLMRYRKEFLFARVDHLNKHPIH